MPLPPRLPTDYSGEAKSSRRRGARRSHDRSERQACELASRSAVILGDREGTPIQAVAALVVHQTGGATAESTFQAYALGGSGARFFVDRDGKIYQTARVTQKTHHVGRIRSRCYELHACAPEDQKTITSILSNRDRSYGARARELHRHELRKDYPTRYPTNSDSLAIELVGAYDAEQSSYEPVTSAQNVSLRWLVSELLAAFGLRRVDVYRHPQVFYKQPSKAETANW